MSLNLCFCISPCSSALLNTFFFTSNQIKTFDDSSFLTANLYLPFLFFFTFAFSYYIIVLVCSYFSPRVGWLLLSLLLLFLLLLLLYNIIIIIIIIVLLHLNGLTPCTVKQYAGFQFSGELNYFCFVKVVLKRKLL